MQTLKQELVNFNTVAKLPKVAGILRGYVNTNMPNSAIFQTGISFGIRGDKDVQSLTVPIKGSYQDINTNNDGSALQIDSEKISKQLKISLKIINESLKVRQLIIIVLLSGIMFTDQIFLRHRQHNDLFSFLQ